MATKAKIGKQDISFQWCIYIYIDIFQKCTKVITSFGENKKKKKNTFTF